MQHLTGSFFQALSSPLTEALIPKLKMLREKWGKYVPSWIAPWKSDSHLACCLEEKCVSRNRNSHGREEEQEYHHWELLQWSTTHQTGNSGGIKTERGKKKKNSQEAPVMGVLSPCSLHPSSRCTPSLFLRCIDQGQTKESRESSQEGIPAPTAPLPSSWKQMENR